MGSGTNNGVRPQCCSLTPLLGSDPVAKNFSEVADAAGV